MWMHVWLGLGRSGPGGWILALLCLAILAVVIILAVWKLPSLLYGDVSRASPDARLQAASSFRTAFVAGLAGLAALGSLAMANRTYRLTQQGQITERYTKAIEQLGSDKLDVRLGGVYALERIATDSERDHPTVVEVLSAFVREHTDAEPRTATVPSTPLQGDGEPATERQSNAKQLAKQKPTTDVRAALTVLGRLPALPNVPRADLSNANLAYANLPDMTLEGFRLRRANLRGANLRGANLQGANLQEANLQKALLWGTRLWGADLQEADLRKANLLGANLEGAVLIGASLQEANLHEANLHDANLHDANLFDANLWGANLQGADLQGAGLQASLQRAILVQANLQGAFLQGANLQGANLFYADLEEANLEEANLWEAILLRVNLKGAKCTADTVWPDGFDWKAAGVILRED
jgi:uncharacterized protein YjbI with pentapeptide repeats